MGDPLYLLLAGLAGIALGAFFFAGLWWTVSKAVTSRWVALWFSGSLLLRTAVVLTGFYFVGNNHWERLLACLLGFLIARIAVLPLTKEALLGSHL